MDKTFILSALRRLRRNQFYFINSVTGLAVAVSAFILILLYVADEYNYDTMHSLGKRIVRVGVQTQDESSVRKGSRIPFPAKAVLLESYPDVERVARLAHSSFMRSPIRYQKTSYVEEVFFADPEFLQVFDFRLIKGDRESALANPNSIILTETAAIRYFGTEDPIGKTMQYENHTDLTVTAILEDIPGNSHIKLDIVLPLEFQRKLWNVESNNFYDLEQDWAWHGAWTYVLLKEGVDVNDFARKIKSLPERHGDRSTQKKESYFSQSLDSIHLTTGVEEEPSAVGSVGQIYSFMIIAALILTIACINFTNLATAQAPKRSKEVGLRKVVGAERSGLVLQFLGESILISWGAVVLGVALAIAAMPAFNTLTGKILVPTMIGQPAILSCLVGLTFLVGILSGIYPSLITSGLSASKAIKGNIVQERSSFFSLRNSLVIMQLIISVCLITGIVVIRDQMDFIRNKDLGFDKENILTIKTGIGYQNFEVLRNQLSQVSGVNGVYQGFFPGGRTRTSNFSIAVEGIPEEVQLPVRFVGTDFVSMFNLKVVAGRNLRSENLHDSIGSALVNEKTLKYLSLSPEDILGRKMSYIGGKDNKTLVQFRVAGVIKDVNFESLYNDVQPAIFLLKEWGDIAIKVQGADIQNTIHEIQNVYKKTVPDWPFSYSFLKEDIDAQYKKEERLANAVQYFTLLAMLICGAGLIALSAFTAQQKNRDIAIRKIHGALSSSIIYRLMGHFFKMGLIGFLIALPLSVYLVSVWLNSFAYRIALEPLLFIKVATFTGSLIMVTVAYQVFLVSKQNPLSVLRRD